MFGLNFGGNEEMLSRLVDEADFGGRYVEALVHDTGKCHEIWSLLNYVNADVESPVDLLADTKHKSESYPLPCLADFLNKANSLK